MRVLQNEGPRKENKHINLRKRQLRRVAHRSRPSSPFGTLDHKGSHPTRSGSRSACVTYFHLNSPVHRKSPERIQKETVVATGALLRLPKIQPNQTKSNHFLKWANPLDPA